jgi:hypothetical protein
MAGGGNEDSPLANKVIEKFKKSTRFYCESLSKYCFFKILKFCVHVQYLITVEVGCASLGWP